MTINRQSQPVLPELFQLPLKLVPRQLRYRTIGKALNTLFADAIAQDELEFIGDRKINIKVEDAALHFCVSLEQSTLKVSACSQRPDLSISGKTYAFLTLATRKEDADTLFFRRQLKSEGDTELGLFVKNFLDGLEPQNLPAYHLLEQAMQKAIRVADRQQKITGRLPMRLQQIIGVA